MSKILIVGAGAIGSVYGLFAERGGAEVSFLVKPKHIAERERGIRFYHHQTLRAPKPIDWKNFKLFSSIESLPKTAFSLIIVTVPSNALHEGKWLAKLAASPAVKGALWICLSPGDTDAEFVKSTGHVPSPAFADGSIPIVSYWAPLPGENFDLPGYAFWLPPGQKFVISAWGEATAETGNSRWDAIVALFRAGGLRTQLQPASAKKLQIGPSLLRAVVASLQNSEWSFQKFLNGPNLHVASESAKEMMSIYAAVGKEKNPAAGWLKGQALQPFAIRQVLQSVAKIAPFDFEAFLRVHFTKVEEQMNAGIKHIIHEGKRLNMPTNYLRQL